MPKASSSRERGRQRASKRPMTAPGARTSRTSRARSIASAASPLRRSPSGARCRSRTPRRSRGARLGPSQDEGTSAGMRTARGRGACSRTGEAAAPGGRRSATARGSTMGSTTNWTRAKVASPANARKASWSAQAGPGERRDRPAATAARASGIGEGIRQDPAGVDACRARRGRGRPRRARAPVPSSSRRASR